jgi:AGCS family alanine or glycine:cation symporter
VFGTPALDGAALTVSAYESALGPFGAVAIAVCTALFAFATLPGWCYYGEQCCRYLFKNPRAQVIYRCAFILFLLPGAVLRLETVWRLADVMNALMALPNLAALFVLSPQVFEGLRGGNLFIRE